MARVKNQDIPAQEVLYDPDPARPNTLGQAYQQAITEGSALGGQPDTTMVRRSPKQGKPSERGPGTDPQKPVRNCFKLCGELWRSLSVEEKRCIRQNWKDNPSPIPPKDIPPEGFPGPFPYWQKCCLGHCFETGEAFKNPDCFVNCCGSAVIGYTTLHMMVNEIQGFTVVGGDIKGVYIFELISGGGTLTPGGVYQAPASNPGCVDNPVIGLFCYEVQLDEISLTVNSWPTCGAARRELVCRTAGQCGGVCYYLVTDCNGVVIIPDPCTPGDFGVCDECADDPNPLCLRVIAGGPGLYSQAVEYFLCPLTTGDLRTSEMIAAGCCPPLL